MTKKNDPLHDEFGEVLSPKGARLNELGQELPDPRQLDPPIGHQAQPPLHELIRQMVQSEVIRRELDALDLDSAEDADDFDIPDDPVDPASPYEEDFDHLDQVGVQGDPPAVAPEGTTPPAEPAPAPPPPPAEPSPAPTK